ncbi:MAG: class I SAM-dependent RNA methyltransferase, partial [Pseudomonadota bacterium]
MSKRTDHDATARYRVIGLGAKGDGLVRRLDDRGGLAPGGEGLEPDNFHVRYVLPGETIRLSQQTDELALDEVVDASSDRIEAVCRHYGVCGGCAMQHASPSVYQSWKSDLVRAAFAQRGLAPKLSPLVGVGLGRRRRVTLTAMATEPGAPPVVGFFAAGSHDVVPIQTCVVADDAINDLLPHLTDLAATMAPGANGLRFHVLVADNGVCLDCDGYGRALPAAFRAKLAERAKAMRLVRLTIDGDPVALNGVPVIHFGTASVSPYPGAFLQAAKAAETVMADAVVAALPKKAKRAADLFCGMGALTFPLAAKVSVFALDSEAEALQALQTGERGTQGLKKIDVRRRDLMRDPLSRKELEPF